jgi:hypothetical protein
MLYKNLISSDADGDTMTYSAKVVLFKFELYFKYLNFLGILY